MSDDANIPTDLLALLEDATPLPVWLSPQVAANIERVRHGMALAAAEPGEGKREWQEDQGRALGISGRMVRHWIAAANAILKCRGREPVPTDLLDGSIKVVPEHVEKFLRGERQPSRRALAGRWNRRASRLLSDIYRAADRIETLEAHINAANAVLRDLKQRKKNQRPVRHPHLRQLPNLLVAYRGHSEIDGEPVIAVLSCIQKVSGTKKTGDVIQVSFLRADLDPNQAAVTGSDHSVCGDCRHRHVNNGTCYVPRHKYEAWTSYQHTQGIPADLTAACEAIRLSNVPVRVGSVGDPSAVPLSVVQALVEAAREPRTGQCHHLCYTHRWREVTDPSAWAQIAMASVDSPEEQSAAQSLGFRTYRCKAAWEPLLPGEVVCPGSHEAGEIMTCAQCLLCSGAGPGARRGKNLVIDVHGSGGKVDRFSAWREIDTMRKK